MSDGWIDAALAQQRDWARGLLDELIAAPTVLGAEEAGQRIMARAFADCGLEPRDVLLNADALRADPHSSPFSWDVTGKRNVVAVWPGTAGGRSVVLNGHIDVVPPAAEALWSHPPFSPRHEGDRVYGRGAGDMKAGLVAMTLAVRTLRHAEVTLAGDVHLQSVVEEECTGNGTLQCLLDGWGADADAAILTEPHPDHFTVAQVGVMWFHVDVGGRPAHAARAAALGHNAFDAAQRILLALRQLESELNAERGAHPHYRDMEHPINLNPGVVSAGDWPSTVPAHCTLSCRLALYPGQRPEELRARVEAAVEAAGATDPFLADQPPAVRYDGFSCEGSSVDEDEPVIAALAGAYRAVHGTDPGLQATTATTDARHFIRHGIPAVCFGPEAREIHGIDESTSLSSIEQTAAVIARFLLAWNGSARRARQPSLK